MVSLTKLCTGCQLEKSVDEFPPDRRAKDGKQSKCRECINEWMRTHYRKDIAWSMVRRAKARAKKEGMEFNINEEDVKPLPITCPVFGVKLRISELSQDPNAYSLDRTDNNKGYIKGNVVVMSYRANRLKNDGTAEEHEAIAAWMRKNESAAENKNTAITRAADRVTVVVD